MWIVHKCNQNNGYWYMQNPQEIGTGELAAIGTSDSAEQYICCLKISEY